MSRYMACQLTGNLAFCRNYSVVSASEVRYEVQSTDRDIYGGFLFFLSYR